jgi:hypothetical protein
MVGAVVAAPAVLGAAVAGASTYAAIRSRYLRPLVRGLDGLDELSEVVAAAVKTGGGFLERGRPDGEDERLGTPPEQGGGRG